MAGMTKVPTDKLMAFKRNIERGIKVYEEKLGSPENAKELSDWGVMQATKYLDELDFKRAVEEELRRRSE